MAFHKFCDNISDIKLPLRFNNPFCYTPHPLTLLAVKKLTAYINTQQHWQEELAKGKMFGVLVVKDRDNNLGFLAAFSGLLDKSYIHPYFVTPVYDMVNLTGASKDEQQQIVDLSSQINDIKGNPKFKELQELLVKAKEDKKSRENDAKQAYKVSKAKRKKLRNLALEQNDSAKLLELDRESQFEKAEIKRASEKMASAVILLQSEVDAFQNDIDRLAMERVKRSVSLHRWLFSQFKLFNGKNESLSLLDIFAKTPQGYPPSGAGECAAPKLLHYAFSHSLTPIAMGEFWWGDSPKEHIRHHGLFYPSCKGRCEPILEWMLQGMDVESNKFLESTYFTGDIEILYEDDYLLAVTKPNGMLSVDGTSCRLSLVALLKSKQPSLDFIAAIHRLDMDTSGVLLLAKDNNTLSIMQKMFENRKVKKEYIALLEGEHELKKGVIELNLMANHLDRPRQMVSFEGKQAITKYEMLQNGAVEARKCTRVKLCPVTGRTHQLRVHAAHSMGLNSPIIGDNLYGFVASRLYLHAKSITFTHPYSGAEVVVVSPVPF